MSENGKSTAIYVSDADHVGVLKIAQKFQEDIERVTSVKPSLITDKSPSGGNAIIVGTIGKSELIDKLTQYKVAPPLLGFGISTPVQVKDAIESGAAGAISGSATVNIIAENLDKPDVMLEKLKSFVTEMKAATHK